MSEPCGFWDDAEVISVYTREQAIADGVLVDITELVRDYFKIPVAVTATVWDLLETIPDWSSYESVGARARDMAHMLCWYIRRNKGAADWLKFSFWITQPGGGPRRAWEVWLKSNIGPGDDGEPVLTIMLPEED